ncbi:hypothetical protein K6R30_000868 [Listeria monocytogenes]|nr:hypothetical protein [Listeria monocytogenes]EHW6563373.1 hypothetical protein [Listeria monocytogenes]EHW6574877.1 hypothetical protein [Listeria monocytogenes]EHZ8108876.1 hypothetical protein [Listeria monocytogenes]
MHFFSLKPKEKKEDIKNYNTYKEALDYCFTPENNINNIGVIGDYGTGKSTIIGTYVKNEVNEEKYDVINVSLLTLEDNSTDSLVLLKNIIKQIVQNPKKKLRYNIVKFREDQLNAKSIGVILSSILMMILIFFADSNFIMQVPWLNNILSWGIPIEIFRTLKYFSLIIIVIFLIIYLYPRLFSGFKIKKFNFTSAFNAELSNSTETIANEEFDYLEYLIYLLERKKKSLVLIIEDIDRHENLKIFQQLREVNNLLNEKNDKVSYKFIYAVGNTLFSEHSKKDKVNIREVYQSNFKSNVTKFFDFVVNVTPVMDNQNSYEFIKENFPQILSDDSVADEDLFMVSQYIDSPRVLIDVVNDYQIMKDMHVDKTEFNDLKLLYFAILKSKFYNFYDLIHEVFADFQSIANLYDRDEWYEEVERNRKDDFCSRTLLYVTKKGTHFRVEYQNLSNIWETINDAKNFYYVSQKYSNLEINSDYSYSKILLKDALEYFSDNQMEYIFSAEEYRKQKESNSVVSNKKISEIVSLYYTKNNSLLLKIIKDVENVRISNPNKPNFSIKEFLDIDYIQLGILENILDANDYNMYISNNYLEVNDAIFIKNFNLYNPKSSLYTLKLYNFKTILSKMKLEKISGANGLNIYLLEWVYIEQFKSDKAVALNINSVNNETFFQTFLEFEFENGMNKFRFISQNITKLESKETLLQLINWLDCNFDISNQDKIENLLKQVSIKNTVSLIDTKYQEFIYLLLIELDIANLTELPTLNYILNRVKDGYKSLLNPILKKYEELIIDNEFDNNSWLNTFNDNIGSFDFLLNTESADTIKRAYTLVNNIKVKELANINISAFLIFIYEGSFYDFSYENLVFIRKKLEVGAIDKYNAYSEYLIENKNELIEFIKNNNEVALDLSNKWDEVLLFEWLRNCDENKFKDTIQFIIDFNPVVFPSLEELGLSFEKLKIIFENVSLYENSYKNISFMYEQIISEDETQVDFLSNILNTRKFNFNELNRDSNLFYQNEQLKLIIFDGALRNDNINIVTFEKYVEVYDNQLENIEKLAKDKISILFKKNKVCYNVNNILLCESEVLVYLFEEEKNKLFPELFGWETSQVIEILQKINCDDKQREFMFSLLSDARVQEKYSIDLIVNYLKVLDKGLEVSNFKIEVSNLLDKLQFKKTDANKIVELFSSDRGQRTIAIEFLDLANILRKKGVIKSCDESYNKLIIKTKNVIK